MIKLIVLDVDGCLTDGKIIYSSTGEETKNFNVKDGLAISSWVKMGRHVAIITGRNSKIVEKRAKELGIKFLFQGVKEKEKVLNELIDSLEIKYHEVAAIGDDLNDYKMLSKVGRSFTPKDGVKEIRELVNTTLTCNGGEAAVREMIDIIVDENDLQEQFLSIWL
ncbi:MAG: 3-deoxy-D-manno-octulosonate 8-phosphate phosphatase [Sulfurimonas sp. RIFOXYD12_FULL_33_39]|uniref:KdsC family phosphatase n=1 Tax=unclassified Sulfurimonas TaxID=2623549 RepID=UPI0008B66FEE|nr:MULTISPECIES: HAD-IIIA family hydrolase [unclassified Sulfurimonas]OHE09399.1 MAG: 3-deoxy-D-manno-octulosonate 8-phosphate phosphatase [Sulfurimonas sp. RIFOXYD12_FULL_33_39]OHE12819.1 MAG: 3-deoxy-D-manno-octulosonate 8-phosphate phosphatase [Sulfurimonas sp. RIFOXYD2_FULL_34_21]DAB28262.1 MAG TPA: 3-deoxy-D-manno-octulosonate 8-phosphate phosphatase [Sulfurimonas sp. UBA10385]